MNAPTNSIRAAEQPPTLLVNPPREFGVMPFWFWNDELTEAEIRRQIADFDAHGVYGFVIHPRVGLPRHLGWMSENLLRFYDIAIDEAQQRRMYVLLYDEGMYPSGSSHGQVVAHDPAFATRALAAIELADDHLPDLPTDWNLLAVLQRTTGTRVAVVDRPAHSRIRGLHYVEPGDGPNPFAGPPRGSDPPEDEPPAADLLNPAAVDCFIRLVYARFAQRYQQHFGQTVLAIFTDEPSVLGKYAASELRPGTTGILGHVQRLLGYDFTPHLLSLWYDDEPDAARHRQAYHGAIHQRLQETYYARLTQWCDQHNLALTGHPQQSEDIGSQRYFHMPGQDLVWRSVTPGPTAMQGRDSTMAKCSSSAMIHLQRRRNSNEFCGAYGHDLTHQEMRWLAHWCLVRGVNLLIPHAFYYSVRGPRRDERPPDVGPHSAWWNKYRLDADGWRRLCWLNTDSQHVCNVAVLASANHLPWRAAQWLQQHQIDFNYLELRHLHEDASVNDAGIELAGMHYRVLIVDGDFDVPVALDPVLDKLARSSRLIFVPGAQSRWPDAVLATDADTLCSAIDHLTPRDLVTPTRQPELRFRHLRKLGCDWYLLFNEGADPLPLQLRVAAAGTPTWIDVYAAEPRVLAAPPSHLQPTQLLLLRVTP